MVCIEGNFQFFPQNFLFEQEVAKHLEEIAKTEGKTQTQIAQEAIEEKYEQISIKKKLETLDEIRDGDVVWRRLSRINLLIEKDYRPVTFSA